MKQKAVEVRIFNLAEEPQHIAQLAEWHHGEWSHLYPGASLEQRIEKMQLHLGPELVPSSFVCKLNGELAGSAAIVQYDMDSHPNLSPWLASVYVKREFRRQGIGGALVRHAMAEAQLGGIGSLYLFTEQQEHFYQAFGWRTLNKENYRGQAVTVMQVRLDV